MMGAAGPHAAPALVVSAATTALRTAGSSSSGVHRHPTPGRPEPPKGDDVPRSPARATKLTRSRRDSTRPRWPRHVWALLHISYSSQHADARHRQRAAIRPSLERSPHVPFSSASIAISSPPLPAAQVPGPSRGAPDQSVGSCSRLISSGTRPDQRSGAPAPRFLQLLSRSSERPGTYRCAAQPSAAIAARCSSPPLVSISSSSMDSARSLIAARTSDVMRGRSSAARTVDGVERDRRTPARCAGIGKSR